MSRDSPKSATFTLSISSTLVPKQEQDRTLNACKIYTWCGLDFIALQQARILKVAITVY